LDKDVVVIVGGEDVGAEVVLGELGGDGCGETNGV
jgi:hypothetical protein